MPLSMLVDSHCHIPLLSEPADQIITEAEKFGVKHILCVSIDLETYPDVLQLAQQYEHVYASVGVHPNTSMQQPVSVETLVEKASDNHVIAIGETGLDYFRSEGNLDWQRERFRTHIKAARAANKPLIIHTREAKVDTIKILEEEHAETVGGVMHCFVEDWDTAEKAIAMNFYISFSGIVTFNNAKTVQEVAKRVPLERMLIETDSPYLAPVPHRGKPNQPGYVYYVAEHIAKLRGIDIDDVTQQTTNNFFKLFNINKFA